MKKPIDILEDAIFYGIALDKRVFPKPGEIIERLPVEKREILKQLKSEDIENLRNDVWLKKE